MSIPKNIDSSFTMNENMLFEILLNWIKKTATTDQLNWLEQKLAAIRSGDLQTLYLSFGHVTRRFAKSPLNLMPEEIDTANNLRKNWTPQFWSVDQVVRSLMVLSFPSNEPLSYLKTIDRLFATGEVHELVALYQTLPLFPFPDKFISRATEGIRTSMQLVFESVAHHNPYPADYLDEMSFNQLVLKAVFVGVPLYKITDLDKRANPELSRMLSDYAKERWAAKREITPELWRCVGKFADQQGLDCLKKIASQGSPLENIAANLAFIDHGEPAQPGFHKISWNEFGKQVEHTKK